MSSSLTPGALLFLSAGQRAVKNERPCRQRVWARCARDRIPAVHPVRGTQRSQSRVPETVPFSMADTEAGIQPRYGLTVKVKVWAVDPAFPFAVIVTAYLPAMTLVVPAMVPVRVAVVSQGKSLRARPVSALKAGNG